MEQKEKEPGILQQVLQKLGRKHTVIADTLTRLKERGIKLSQSRLYQIIADDEARKEVVDVFLEVAEEEFTRRRHVQERAQKLVAEA
ncbi:hypothetical protein FY528_05390 [Hymenobacter lutimineralis]|uniref:Uncharacterized protein n=1 Tax=Hymenobacter lutimineralis TaxID=2606448 RepID=A0A5D6VA34_9BACT|nr:hypothetical protein [Hymenobacter lutimineralis]TYZ12723.1 hypothetical protein FY528_05390 [Hymenobacter lutimineralis]